VIERRFFHSREETPPAPCITRLHVEIMKNGGWHIVVYSGEACAGVLCVNAECGQPLVDMLMPEAERIEGGTRATD
jgi:hypothetical protein